MMKQKDITNKINLCSFSLIELLVVIAIIGVLTSILLPALRKSKSKGYLALCKSNYKQHYLGLAMYADDFNGVLPSGAANKPGSAETGRLRSDISPNPFMGIGTLFDTKHLDDSALKTGICPTWEEGTDTTSNWIKSMRSAVVDKGLGFDDIKTNYYLVFTASYGVQNATRMVGSNKIGNTHNFESNNLLYIDGHVKTFQFGDLYSVANTWSSVENWRYNFDIWDLTGNLD